MSDFNKFDDSFALMVCECGKKYGLSIIPVGGIVRDFFLERESVDYDFLVIEETKILFKDKFESFLKDFADSYKLNKVKPSRFETVRLVNKQMTVDFSPVKRDGLISNLLSRDLTINSIAYFFENEEFIDPANGREDIKKQILRVYDSDNFKKDALRILRLYRFYSALEGFEIEKKTEKYAFKYSHLLKNVAKERIVAEIYKIFSSDRGFKSVKRMFYPVLSAIFPCLEKIKSIPQNGYHHLDVFHHTLEVLKGCFYLDKFKAMFPFFNFELTDEDKIVLRLAALFHDVGKAETFAYNEEGITVFRNHQFASGSAVLKEMSFFPKKTVERVYLLVRRHMLFLNFMVNGYSEKSFRKMINMMREDSVLLALLFLADKNAARGPKSSGNFEKAVFVVTEFLKFYKKEKEKILNLPKLVSGYDVIKILDIAPSKEVGKVLNFIMEKQLENPSFSREDALKLIYSLKTDRERKIEG